MRVLISIQTVDGLVNLTDGSAVTLTDRATGEARTYVPGVRIESDVLTFALSFLSADTGPRSVSFTVLGTGGGTVQGLASVSILDGESLYYSDAKTIAEGELSEIVADEHYWSATVTDDPMRVSGFLLDDRAVVDTSSWPRTDAERIADGDVAFVGTSPGIDPRAAGAQYPLPIGFPGLRTAGDYAGGIYGTNSIGSPGILCELGTVLVAADQTILIADGVVDAATVRRISFDSSNEPYAEDLDVEVAHDRRGRAVSVVKPSTNIIADSEQWIAWQGGGISDPYGVGVLRRVDHVIRWALDRSGERIDWQSMSPLAALSGMQIDTVITGQVDALDWLRSQVLPLLPVSVTEGPDGLYVWPWVIVDDRDPVTTITTGENAQRPEPWRRETPGAMTRCTVSYAHDARSGLATRRWTTAGAYRTTDDRTEVGLDLYARRMHAIFGERIGSPVEAEVICDPATAQLVARWKIWAACRLQAVGTFFMRRDDRLRPGAPVMVADPVVSAVAQVEEVRYTGADSVAVTVRAWPE